jgi:hypothetical protein
MTCGVVTYVVGSIIDIDDVPVLSPELGRSVVSEARVDRAVNSNVIVVVDEDQIVKTPVSSERNR